MSSVANALQRLQRSRERCLIAIATQGRGEAPGWCASLLPGAGRAAWWSIAVAVWRAYRKPAARVVPPPNDGPPIPGPPGAPGPHAAPGLLLGAAAVACVAAGAYALMSAAPQEHRDPNEPGADAPRR